MHSNNSEFMSMLSVSRAKAEKNLEEAKNYIIMDLRGIRDILSSYHPLEIAKMSVWEARKGEKNTKDPFAKASFRLLPILIQSVLLSKEYVPSSNNRDVKNKDWQRILSLSQDVSRKLSRYIDSLVLIRMNDGLVTREDILDYRSELYEQYFPSEKTMDIINAERSIAEASFISDRSLVEKTFSVSPETLVKDLYEISSKALTAIDKLKDDSQKFKETVEERIKEIKEGDPSISDDGAMREAYKNAAIRDEGERIRGLRDDFDLFRPEFYSNITKETMDALSSECGKVDTVALLFEQGLWSATCYPFIKLSGMHFTFVARYLLAIYQRFSYTSMHIGYMVTSSAESALSFLFTATDIVGVYSFNGRKIDVTILSSLTEINLVSESELWQQRMKRRSSEMEEKPLPGHIMLIVNPDGKEEIEKLGDDRFLTSVLHLLKIKDDNNLRHDFYEMLLGLNSELSDTVDPLEREIFEDDESVSQEEVETDPDVLMMDGFDDDEYAMDGDKAEEDEDDYTDPMSVSRFVPSLTEIIENEKIYEDTHETILKELEKDVDNSQYRVVDEDELVADEDDADTDDGEDDPDQLDFLDLLDDYDVEDDKKEDNDDLLPSVNEDLDLLDAEDLFDEVLEEEDEEDERTEEEKEAIDPLSENELRKEDDKEHEIKEIEEKIGEEEESAEEELNETEASDEQSMPFKLRDLEDDDELKEIFSDKEEKDESSFVLLRDEKSNDDISMDDESEDDNLSDDVEDLEETESDVRNFFEDDEELDSSDIEDDENGMSDDFTLDEDLQNEEENADDYPFDETEENEEDLDEAEDGFTSKDEEEIEDHLEEDNEAPEENGSYSQGEINVLYESDEEENAEDSSLGETEESEEDLDEAEDGFTSKDEEGIEDRLEEDNEAQEENDSYSQDEINALYEGDKEENVARHSDDSIVLEYEENKFDSSKFSKIIQQILENVEGDATPFYEFLEKEDESVISYFENVIHQSWLKQMEDGKDKMFSVFEYDMSILLSKGKIYDDLRLAELMNNAGAVMYSQGKSEWHALILHIAKDFSVDSAKIVTINRESFSPSNWKIVTNIGDALIARKNSNG